MEGSVLVTVETEVTEVVYDEQMKNYFYINGLILSALWMGLENCDHSKYDKFHSYERDYI